MKLSINHRTEYRYSELVQHSTQYLRLTPRPSSRQRILNWQMALPESAERASDGYNNILHVLTLDRPHQEIALTVKGEVEITDEDGEHADHRLSPLVFTRYTTLTEPDEALRALASDLPGDNMGRKLENLSEAILTAMPFTPGATDVASSASAAYRVGKGVCQDHTHVFLACCRALGMPARYVSGYLYSQDSSHVASHAWAEAHVDGLGWVGFDVSNGISPDARYVRVATGLDYTDAAPISGLRFGDHGSENLVVDIQVAQ